MLAVPTTTVRILRGTSTNSWGDEVDDPTPHQSGVPASVLEQTQTVAEADSDAPSIVRAVTARVGAGTDVQQGDRIEDERTGQVYVIESITTNQNPLFATDVRLSLKRVS